MNIYLSDILNYMSEGSIAVVHVQPENLTFICEISSTERRDEFKSYIYRRAHPYLKVTSFQGLKFVDKGLEIFCE